MMSVAMSPLFLMQGTEGCGHYVPADGIPSLIEVCLVGFDHFALLSKPPRPFP